MDDYEELKFLGRGSYGEAHIVRCKRDGKLYVSKQVHLSSMTPKEKEGAHREVEVLGHLDHPNIVAYKESYLVNDTLHIIMQYCDGGDLAMHIKKRKAANKPFKEREILNLFVQIASALQYVHKNHILHRDLKTQNIFLMKNNVVKVGDFGISRVLESTNQAAMSVVGTPYYMSPEVCENKPYSYKSDCWALGCVLYEMCVLKHAFQADNLLSLVYKIVQETYEPVPSIYSTGLRGLVSGLLRKNASERPSLSQTLASPFLLPVMEDWVNYFQGQERQLASKSIHVVESKTVTPVAVKSNSTVASSQRTEIPLARSPQRSTTVESPKVVATVETPKERLARRKAEEAERERQRLIQAAKESAQERSIAKERRYQEFHNGGGRSSPLTPSPKYNEPVARSSFEAQIPQPRSPKPPEFTVAPPSTASPKLSNRYTSVNDDSEDDDWYTTGRELQVTVIRQQDSKRNTYDRPIRSSPEPARAEESSENEYEEDFEEYEEEEDTAAQTKDLTRVVDLYKNQLATSKAGVRVVDESPPRTPTPSITPEPPRLSNRLDYLRAECKQLLGVDLFKKVYRCLAREDPESRNDSTHRELMALAGKQHMNACFKVDNLIFLEQQHFGAPQGPDE
eukprot:GILK01009475.1.p1 GENE.GILK01009475.1~~GILK01009475.1.p1  ORF type:complete len:649 (-),score=124.07 GILK01009475.1:252-2123(-)